MPEAPGGPPRVLVGPMQQAPRNSAMLAHVKSVLNFSAFRPDPDDSRASWGVRFPGRTTGLLHLGRNTMVFARVNRDGEMEAAGTAQGEYKQMFTELGTDLREGIFEGWYTISVDTRYVISIESNLSRKPGSEAAMRKDPRSMLHARYEKGKRYAVTHNPETNSSLLLTMDEENIKKIETLCREQKLKVGRICCGAYVLLRHALSVTNIKKGSETPFSALYIICCNGSVCALLQEKDHWIEVRSRPDLFTEDPKPLLDLLQPFQEKLGEGTGVVLVCNEPLPSAVMDALVGMFPGRAIQDLTKTGFLARLLHTY